MTFLMPNNTFLVAGNLNLIFPMSITSCYFYCCTLTKFLAIHNKLIPLRPT